MDWSPFLAEVGGHCLTSPRNDPNTDTAMNDATSNTLSCLGITLVSSPMNAARPLPRDSALPHAPLALQAITLFLSPPLLGQHRLSAQTLEHDFVIGREVVQDLQLPQREPARHEQDPQGHEEQDEHGEGDGREGVRDGDARGDAGHLDGYEEGDLAPRDGEQGLVALDEPQLGVEEQEFLEDAVGLDGSPLGRQKIAGVSRWAFL